MQLAQRYGARIEAARLAGWLHDYARDLPAERLIELAERAHLITCTLERKVPDLLHGPVAATLIESIFAITDAEIKQAIAVHTLGTENMGLLDKILYVADLIEPGRNYPGVEQLCRLAEVNLDQALLTGFNQTLRYCLEKNYLLHPQTIQARNYLLEQI